MARSRTSRRDCSTTSTRALLTFAFAAIIIAMISMSRMYLGVHYPSDILAGLLDRPRVGRFCMAVLEAAQLYAKRNAPQLLANERPAAQGASPSS